MENNGSDIITTKEAAAILQVKPATIHKYVKAGKLQPVYHESWHLDTTKLFYLEDIEALKRELVKPGITTGEAADMLGVHITTITQYIQKGLLKAEKKRFRGRDIYFIEPEELERFKNSYTEKRKWEKKEFWNKDTGYAWFQSFRHKHTNEYGRILYNEETGPYLKTTYERKLEIERIGQEDFLPVYPIPDRDYINKRGYAAFRFPLEHRLESPVYSLIDFFYQHVGPKNMKLTLSEDHIKVEIKPLLLPLNKDLHLQEIDLLHKGIQEGKVYVRHNGVYIDSVIETIVFSAPVQLKKQMKEDADELGLTMEEYVLKMVRDYYNKV